MSPTLRPCKRGHKLRTSIKGSIRRRICRSTHMLNRHRTLIPLPVTYRPCRIVKANVLVNLPRCHAIMSRGFACTPKSIINLGKRCALRNVNNNHAPVFAITSRRIMSATLPLHAGKNWRNVSRILKRKSLIGRTIVLTQSKSTVREA